MNKSISKNIFFKLLLNIFNLIIPILIGPYALRVLGPENMGIVNFSQTIYGYFYIKLTKNLIYNIMNYEN